MLNRRLSSLMRTLHFWFYCLILVSHISFALPSIENLTFLYDKDVSGKPICGTERLTFTYGSNPGNDTQWGIGITRDGERLSALIIRPQSLTGIQTLTNNVLGGQLVSGKNYQYQLVAYNYAGQGVPSSLLNVQLPNCDGTPSNGVEQLQIDHFLVSFSDFAQLIPFTESEYQTRILETDTVGGGHITLTEFFAINSYQKVSLKNQIFPWLVLPHPMSHYCENQMVSANADRGLTLGFKCDTTKIKTDTLNAATVAGIRFNGNITNFVVNGMGAAGLQGLNSTFMSADSLWKMSHTQNSVFTFWTLAHELGHALGNSHSNSFEKCINGRSPTDFLSGYAAIGSECLVARYGTSVMGGATSYPGFSGPQRQRMGMLKGTQILDLGSITPQTIELFDLDSTSIGNHLIKMSSPLLPTHFRVFIEYSKPAYALAHTIPNPASGIRVGLTFDYPPFTKPIDSSKDLSNDAEVIYLDDISLKKVGDSVNIKELNIELHITSVNAESIVISITPSSDCEKYSPTMSIGSFGVALLGQPQTYSVSVSNNDITCAPRSLVLDMKATESNGTTIDQKSITTTIDSTKTQTLSLTETYYNTNSPKKLLFTLNENGTELLRVMKPVFVTSACNSQPAMISVQPIPASVKVGTSLSATVNITNADTLCLASNFQFKVETSSVGLVSTNISKDVAAGASDQISNTVSFLSPGVKTMDLVVLKNGVEILRQTVTLSVTIK